MPEIWLDAPHLCDVTVRVLPQHEEEEEETEAAAVHVLYASSQFLSQIPYFASSLSEPWQPLLPDEAATTKRELILYCPLLTCPADVSLCLRFLKEDAEAVVLTVDLVLKVLSAASYLGYEACEESCMQYLAAAVWSAEEKAAVKKTFAALNINPSADVVAKLEPIKDVQKVLKDMLIAHLSYSADTLEKFVKDVCLLSPDIARMCTSALNELWLSKTEKTIKVQSLQGDPLVRPKDVSIRLNDAFSEWQAYTRVILLHGDVGEILKQLVDRAEEFCGALVKMVKNVFFSDMSLMDTVSYISELLERVVPNKGSGSASTLLTNSERATLFKAFSRLELEFGRHNSQNKLATALENIVLSLPILDGDYSNIKEGDSNLRRYCFRNKEVWQQRLFLDLFMIESSMIGDTAGGMDDVRKGDDMAKTRQQKGARCKLLNIYTFD